MKSGKHRAIGTVVMICVAVALIGCRLWPRERLLLQRSTLIADTEDWGGGRRFYNSVGIHWLGDGALLFDRFVGVKPNDHRIIYRRDLRTGREEEIKDLTRTRDGFSTEVVDSEAVSPDGRWYLCSNRWGDCLLAEVGGKKSYRYPTKNDDCYRSVLWMADGRHWLENFLVNSFSHHLVLHDVVNPKLSTVIPLTGRAALYGHLQAARDPKTLIAIVNPSEEIGYNTDGSPPEKPADPRFVITRFSLQSRAQLTAQYRVLPPQGGDHVHCWVSPQGDRIAWQMTAQRQNQMLALAHRIIPSIQAPSVQTVELWVSGIDGGNMHELGHVVASPISEDEDPIWLDVKWLPDGTKLSYKYKDRFYTIRAK